MANGKVVIGFLVVLAAAGAASWYGGAFTSEREEFVQRCEAELANRLRAPATYRRVSAGEVRRSTASLEECMGWPTAEDRAADEAAARRNSTVRDIQADQLARCNASPGEHVSLVIEYDAANAYGTPVRGRTVCSSVSPPGAALSEVGRFGGLRIDGYTALSWSMRALRN